MFDKVTQLKHIHWHVHAQHLPPFTKSVKQMCDRLCLQEAFNLIGNVFHIQRLMRFPTLSGKDL